MRSYMLFIKKQLILEVFRQFWVLNCVLDPNYHTLQCIAVMDEVVEFQIFFYIRKLLQVYGQTALFLAAITDL